MSTKRPACEDHDTSRPKKRRKGQEPEGAQPAISQQKRENGDYTVGWICAITTEYVAAQAFLDEKHGRPEYVHPHDNNDYTLGRIGQHNVVVAVLPEGEYGTSSAAVAARDMLHSFPNVRIGLMVGIGGGAPTLKHDIRLGDIVVSAPRDGKGGVFQYDFGKTIQEQSFRPTGFLNQPPTALRTAMGGLKAEYESDGHQLDDAVNGVLEKKPRLKRKYKRPDPDTDKLYLSGLVHPTNDEANCAEVCGGDPSKLVPRNARTEEEDNPAVHYGIVASANQLMKNAALRDKFAKENGVLCFEMEAAGLMNHFPCLVIRGICDYSDTHKNKEWQGYAAMTAAAYAKDLLNRIPVNKIEAERRITDVLSDLREVTETHRDIAQQQLKIHQDQLVIQQNTVKQKLSDKQNECLQLFRLTKSTEDVTYEWYKDRVEDRVEDTCMWFLNHSHFQEWSKQDSGSLLVSADPGCGKSVLAKHLIDHALPRSATLCYFFFKDQDQNTVRQALCALLHQLFSQKPFLIQHAMKHFEREGPGLINSSNSLWAILGDAVKDSQAGSIIIVLDALDECIESEFENMMRNVESQMRGDQPGYGKLKYLLTSRPYEQIVSKFRGLLDAFPRIHIPGEEESETISQEVNRVIESRVERLAREKGLSDTVKNHLAGQLLGIPHRTYLWIYLVFDYLKTEGFKKTVRGVQSSIETLPKNINQAYERILNKSKEHVMVRKALSIILAAGRPLTLSEMNLAMNIDESLQTIDDLDLEEEYDFKSRLRSWCGLFVSVYHGKIYFLHQTAREFLLANLPMPSTISTEPQWQRSITIHQAHNILAEVCVRYLNLFNSDAGLLAGSTPEIYRRVDRQALLDYSARFWGLHFREACIKQDDSAIVSIALRVSDPDSKAYSAWSTIYWKSQYITETRIPIGLIVAAHLGHGVVVKRLLAEGADVNAQGEFRGNALYTASSEGYKDIVELLIKEGANVNAEGGHYGNALQAASLGGHKDVVELLIKKGANVNAQGGLYGNALYAASYRGYKDIVELLIKEGANVNAQGEFHGNALQAASYRGYKDIVELLVKKGADVKAEGGFYGNALYAASLKGHKDVVELLIKEGAHVKAEGGFYGNALYAASYRGYKDIVELLIKAGANVNAEGGRYGNALQAASLEGHKDVVELLIKEGANVNAQGGLYSNALYTASSEGYKDIVELLIKAGANVNAQGGYFGNALQAASLGRYKDIVELLIREGAHINAQGGYFGNALCAASLGGHKDIVELLVKGGAHVNAQGRYFGNALQAASLGGHKDTVELLVKEGADFNARGGLYGNALCAASLKGHKDIVELLRKAGAT